MLRILISFFLIYSCTFYGQTLIERLDAAKQDINSLLLTYDDGTFQILDIADADSQFLNTFEILEDCFAFIAASRDSLDSDNEKFINGIYKNNQLIWISDQINSEAYDAFIYDIKDYNNNGNPEIIYAYSWGRGVMTDEVWWIYSWDGTSGNLISWTDEINYTKIQMSGSSARIIDLNSDGILEILGSSDINSDSTLTFSWNGFLYGDWSNGLQARDFYYTTANIFQAKVLSSAIKTTDDTIKYYYSVYNLPSSKQNIYKIYLSFEIDTFYSISPSGWECNKWRDEPLVEFEEHNLPADLTLEEFLSGKFKFLETEGVSPGDSITGMWLVSESLPIIIQYFLRSKSKLVQPSDDLELSLQRYIQDIYENSLTGFTIGPSSIPFPLIPSDFLDSLINYNQRSLELSWITNQTTADKYDSLFTSAKAQLQQNNNNAARTTLQTLLQEVDVDSTDNLTSEAYALLRYNTEYLIEKIPLQPQLALDIINPAMSLVNPGAFTMEVKGSGFNSSSVVYFNGNARATTFVSDSVLNTQILSTDVSAAGNFPVWVSDNSLNSDTLIYKVVSALPQPVRPVLECVTNNGDGTYTAFFGYKNENSVSVYIPVGSKNKFTPNPQDRGQTRVFKPGRQIKVYTVNFNGSNLVWTLNGRTSTASANSAPCQ